MAHPIALIAAMTKNRVIGKNNTLPWDIPEDLKLFRKTTKESVVIMGRKTYESIGRPLPKRFNIVLTSQEINVEGIHTCSSVEAAIELAQQQDKPIFIIGGSGVYAAFLEIADMMYLSFVKKDYEGDTYFPVYNESQWYILTEKEYDEFTHKILKRK